MVASLVPAETVWPCEPVSGKFVSTLALTPTLSPEERETPPRTTDVSASPLPAPGFLFLLQQPQDELDRSLCLKTDDNSPSPGGEGRGEGGPNHPLPGGATADSRQPPLKSAENEKKAAFLFMAWRLCETTLRPSWDLSIFFSNFLPASFGRG